MFNCRIAFRQPNAFGPSPIDPTLIPLALLRAHAAVKDPELLEEGIYELRRNLVLGRPILMVPRKMLQYAGRRLPNWQGYTDPTLSAATVCAAFQSAQYLAPYLRTRYFNAPSYDAIEDARESAFRALVPVRGKPIPAASASTAQPQQAPATVLRTVANAFQRAQQELEMQHKRALDIIATRKPTVNVK